LIPLFDLEDFSGLEVIDKKIVATDLSTNSSESETRGQVPQNDNFNDRLPISNGNMMDQELPLDRIFSDHSGDNFSSYLDFSQNGDQTPSRSRINSFESLNSQE
jgi:hypothetical protein